ncbi:hypothetical protein [Bradyrhizobium niftali]
MRQIDPGRTTGMGGMFLNTTRGRCLRRGA